MGGRARGTDRDGAALPGGPDRCHFAALNLAGFHHLADAPGGVPACLNRAVKDTYSGADFPAVPQTLDGRQSLAFVRQRHGLERGTWTRPSASRPFSRVRRRSWTRPRPSPTRRS
ncbi:LCP family protein [Streptomyces sp. NPDC058682]|uniref:LCP family glycopolymer transferase n=1 Tax=Streptomyces sp. NPDC058682 TaxID=3346596 RepID=UPI00364E93C5